MRSLHDLLLQADPLETKMRLEATASEAQYLRVLDGAAPIFREQALRFTGAVPVNVVNDPGVITSRKLSLVDISDAEIDEKGTGGLFDEYAQGWQDQNVLRIKKNVKITDLDAATFGRSGGVDPWRQLGILAGEKVAQGLNKVIVKTVRGSKGITTVSGSLTSAGASWQTAGNFYKSVVLAKQDLRPYVGDAAMSRLALLANSADLANAENLYANSMTPQLVVGQASPLLPGGVFTSDYVTPGEAWFYANTPTVMELEVFEDLTTIPLPRGDEESRARVRTSVAFHITKATGITKITGIA